MSHNKMHHNKKKTLYLLTTWKRKIQKQEDFTFITITINITHFLYQHVLLLTKWVQIQLTGNQA